MATDVTWDQVCARRLHRHGLVDPLPTPAAAAAAMCGAHAQIPVASEVSLALRVDGATRADVQNALWSDRSLVRTVGPRGTVHLVPAADLGWWSAALDALPAPGGQPPDVRLDAAQIEAVVAAIDAALSERDHTLEELDAAVVARCGAWAVEPRMNAFADAWPRWRQAIRRAATRGVLCFAPNRGRRTCYTHPRRWVGELDRPPAEIALRRLVHDYLHAYGPALPAHVAQWLAVPPSALASTFATSDLAEVELEGEPMLINRADERFSEVALPTRLLPYFDGFAVGSHPRSLLFRGRAVDRALARSQAGNFPVVLVRGRVAGVWHQRRTGRRTMVTVELLSRENSRTRAEVAAQAERLGTILGSTVDVSFGPVSAGPHA